MGNVRDPEFRGFLIDEDDIEFEKWALDAWTIIRSPEIPQQWEDFEGWGLSKNYRGPIPKTKLVNYNARFSTYITEYDGNLDKLRDWLDSDLITLHYLIGRNYQDVLNIGAGGGREVLNALNHDVRKITAIDISTVVINDIMKDRLREFSGGLYFDPRVHALAEEGRSFTERTPEKYDLIDFSIVGGMNLEKMDLVRIDDLFTMEALESYLNHLKEAGVFSYVMYTTRSDIVDEMADSKLLTRVPYIPALRTLVGLRFVFEKNYPDLDFKNHILIAGLHGVVDPRYDLVHIIMSRSPFSKQEQARFLDTCRDLDFVPFYPAKLSGDSSGGLYADVVENSDIVLMAQSLPFNILPATDDMPFHYSFGWRQLREAYEEGNLIAFLSRNPIVSMGTTMSLLAVLVTLVPLFWFTFRKGVALPDLGNSWSLLLFFAFVGYGYMAVEIATLFKLHLYLGKPIYGLSVGLFSFLFSSGLGSNFTHRFETRELPKRLYGCVASILVIGFGFFLWSGALFSATMFLPLIARIAVAVFAIFPLAFIMGMFFPMGIKLISGEQEALIPWAWAINGCLSVVGIFGTRAVALFLGFDQSLLIGLLTYSLVAVCTLLFSRARDLA